MVVGAEAIVGGGAEAFVYGAERLDVDMFFDMAHDETVRARGFSCVRVEAKIAMNCVAIVSRLLLLLLLLLCLFPPPTPKHPLVERSYR